MYHSRTDEIFLWTLRGFAFVAGVIVVMIIGFLVVEGLPVLRQVGLLQFFTDSSWNPTEKLYNFTPMLWGTLLATTGSVLIAAPLGIISAIFCQYYAPRAIAIIYRRVIELLAGIPSVVYGFWGLVVLVPLIARLQAPGTSLLAGIAILALMILPTIALTADASFAKVSPDYLQAAAALGFSRWTTVWGVVLPAAKSGLLTGLILATGRALGETMAVFMVCGNVVQTPKSLFEPMRTLTANIALEMAYATGNHRSALFLSGLVLMAMIVALVAVAEVISKGHIYE
ncbi:MAG: phosphate ABC transporter permease subunit PstC [Symploca sp. SIO3C6]|nr:phosphate ABC transporter permease subunit PstC [Symploca sp. SIO3C6]